MSLKEGLHCTRDHARCGVNQVSLWRPGPGRLLGPVIKTIARNSSGVYLPFVLRSSIIYGPAETSTARGIGMESDVTVYERGQL